MVNVLLIVLAKGVNASDSIEPLRTLPSTGGNRLADPYARYVHKTSFRYELYYDGDWQLVVIQLAQLPCWINNIPVLRKLAIRRTPSASAYLRNFQQVF